MKKKLWLITKHYNAENIPVPPPPPGLVTVVHTVKCRRVNGSEPLTDGHTVKGKHVHGSEPLTVDHTVKRHTR